ncbi:TetR family transcriptional regulator [Streptomyces sp. NPDC048506]|uniref:TetR family transcriptional regulator n=1 Tax=Streptomyces sp. NPDC048506 TaxID=3155028 RepID=UPI00343699F6
MAKQDRAVRTRQELIRSAAEAFDRVGFGHASLAEISAAAGVSSGALHFHLGNKRALGEEVESAAIQTLHRIIGRQPPGHDAALQPCGHPVLDADAAPALGRGAAGRTGAVTGRPGRVRPAGARPARIVP